MNGGAVPVSKGRRERHQQRRRQRARDERARTTQAQQDQAAVLREAFARRARRRNTSMVLFAVAVVIAVAHFFEHMGVIKLFSPGLEDVLIGWPMAGVLALIAAIRLPA